MRVMPNDKAEREAGENPARSRHCKVESGCTGHWEDPGRRRAGEETESGNLLHQIKLPAHAFMGQGVFLFPDNAHSCSATTERGLK